MRSFTATAFVAAGLFGLAPSALAEPPHTRQPHASQPRTGQPHVNGQPRASQPRTGQPHVNGQPRASQPRTGQPHVNGQPRASQAHVDPSRAREPRGRSFGIGIVGQASHLRPAVGEVDVIRWTVNNMGGRPLDHVRLDASIPAGWTVRNGPACANAATYVRCDLGHLDPGRRASVAIPMTVRRPAGPVVLHAWSGAAVGKRYVPGPETSFQVVVTGRH